MRIRSVCSAGFVLLTLACGHEKPTDPGDGIPTVASVSVFAGGGQTAPVSTALSTPVTFKVTGSDGDPYEGATVTFSASGGGTANPTSGISLSNGLVYTTWTLGSATGTQTLTATASGHTASASATASAVISLTTPTLSVTSNSSTKIDLSWTAVPSATSYRIERCSGVFCNSFLTLTTTAAGVTTYSNTGLTANTYRYQVRAEAGDIFGTYSTPVTSSTEMPTTATLTAATTGVTSIKLQWNNTLHETGYVLERCSGAGCSSFATVANPAMDDTIYNDQSVSGGFSYSYRIRAVNGQIDGANSATVTATTITPLAPVLSVRPGTNTTNLLTWPDIANESSYEVLYCTGANCTPSTLLASPAGGAVSYTHTGSVTGTIYRYRVRGINGVIGGPVSNTVEVSTNALTANGSAAIVSGLAGSKQYYWVDIPSGCDSLMIWLKAGNGNANVYFGQNAYPDGTGLDGAFGSQSGGDGVSEGMTLTAPAAGRWYVMVSGVNNFSAYELYNSPVKVLTEPSFEQQGTWQMAGDAYRLSGAAHTGSVAAMLSVDSHGGPVLTNGSVSQDVVIPTAAHEVVVQFYRRILTYEPHNTAGNEYDFLYVRVRSTTGVLLATLLTLSNVNVSLDGAYSPEAVDLTPYRGQTIRLSFESTNDYSYATQFHIDDVNVLWVSKRR